MLIGIALTIMTKSIGIDIGGTNFRVGVFEHVSLITETRVQANFSTICKTKPADEAWLAILDLIANSVEKAISQHQDIRHIGIGFPGFINPETNILSESPNLPGLQNINLALDLTKRLNQNVQISPVVVENDALAASYGEYCLIEETTDSLLYFGLGTGVGGGLILSGKPYAGRHGMAMEVGHIIVAPNGRLCGCGNSGCVEQYASASGVEHSYFEKTSQQLTAYQIASAARQGDQAAIAAFSLAGERLAIAVAHTLKVVDVSTVVIGGGMSKAWDLMQASFDQSLQDNLIPVLRGKTHIIISSIEDKAGMLGAAMMAVNQN